LKVLNLSNSKYLTTSPDFSQVPQLEILILEGCTSFVQVHESIGYLKRLVSLNLKNCTNLKDLPRSIINLESLESLDLSGCSALERLPMSPMSPLELKNTKVFWNLKTVSLSGCSRLTELPNFLPSPHLESLILEGCTRLEEVHESIGLLKRLVLLDLRRCEKLRSLPRTISNLESLKTLNLFGCIRLDKLPKELGNMTALMELYAGKTAIKQLPFSFSLLKNLEFATFLECEYLIESPEFSEASRLKTLILTGCKRLVKVHDSIKHLKRLSHLSLMGCENLTNLPSSICNLESLRILVLTGCFKLDELPEELGRMAALRNLSANGTAIKKLPPSFGGLRDLESVYLSGCGGPSSSWISPKNSNTISSLLSIRSLSQLDLSGHNLSEGDIPNKFACSSSLSTLNLSRNNFRNLPDCIGSLPRLLNLYLNECTILQSISVPEGVHFLEANDCTSLETISVSKNESPRCFHLNNCPKLVKISLENLRPDSEVFMARCNNLSPEFRERVLQVLSLSLSLSLVL